jgi:hypothetical protein
MADFAELTLPGMEFFLDVDAVWTMQELIEADILIGAKSSFSYCAALISDGVKILEHVPGYFLPGWEWRFFPADDWLPCLADGSFNGPTFDRQLLRLMQAKAAITGPDCGAACQGGS